MRAVISLYKKGNINCIKDISEAIVYDRTGILEDV